MATDIVQAEETDASHEGEHHYSDTFTVPIFGEMTLNGGIYTFIFGVLAVLTILEVTIAELLGGGPIWLKGILLLGAAVVKSLLVIAFYMHLKRDNWLFRFVLGVPFFVTLVSVLYLLGVNPTAY
jgi:caa(3)-type oxidase subunit IV